MEITLWKFLRIFEGEEKGRWEKLTHKKTKEKPHKSLVDGEQGIIY